MRHQHKAIKHAEAKTNRSSEEVVVGVLDTATGTFTAIPTTAAGVTANPKYSGAAAVGTRVF